MIRCKFKCNEITKKWNGWHANENGTKGRNEYDYKFSPVVEGSEENKKFFAYTPCGSFNVQTILIDAFVPGKEYYIDISEASEAVIV